MPSTDGMPKVYLCPVTIPADEGKKLLEKQLKKSNITISGTAIMHVCFDMDSERIYVINANEFEQHMKQLMLKAVEIRIAKDFGGGSLSMAKPIEGSPFSSIRVRSVDSFGYVVKAIADSFPDQKLVNLPVIEANLERMPSTLKHLPELFKHEKFTGGYISPKTMPQVRFIDELDNRGQKRKQPLYLLDQPTPCIVLNISAKVKMSAADKERTVLMGYRDYLYDQAIAMDEKQRDQQFLRATSFADIYAAKRFLYLGYPFEEVCKVFFEMAKDFGGLYNSTQRLMQAANELENDGYPNPARIPYFMTFRIDPKTFPLRLNSIMGEGNTIDPNKQLPYFLVIEYDINTNYIIIQTPAYIEPDLCMKILHAQNRPLITRYNPATGKVDVKSTQGVLQQYKQEQNQLAKITALNKYQIGKLFPDKKDVAVEYRDDERAKSVSQSSTEQLHLRKISDYYYACDRIKKICKERGIPFFDLDVVVGPIERLFGRGTQGGFMSKQNWLKSKMKTPHELEKGLFVSPPMILINSATMPGYDEQTETLIHEYSHNLYNIVNPEHQAEYNKPENKTLKEKDNNQWWYIYLTDPDERQAHLEELKYELHSGKSPDEIIRDKVGGKIDANNYAIALKFKELVDEAMEALAKEEEQDEKPVGTSERTGRPVAPVT